MSFSNRPQSEKYAIFGHTVCISTNLDGVVQEKTIQRHDQHRMYEAAMYMMPHGLFNKVFL